MENKTQASYFAPVGRADEQLLQLEFTMAKGSELIKALLDAMPDFLLVLNEQRQIVAVNQRLLVAFGVGQPEQLLGMRPGEALGCMHVPDGPDGCGTARNCSVCGAVLAILASQESGLPQQRECRLALGSNGCQALDLDVLATPITLQGHHFTVLALRDISDEKRRYVMERVFFHDILNNAGGIRGLAALLAEGSGPVEVEQEYKELMLGLADNMIEEIKHQRSLMEAEQGTYEPRLSAVNLRELLQDIRQLYLNHDRVGGREISIDQAPDCTFTTDRTLLRRIVGNMVLNALEACKIGDVVELWGHCQSGRVRISVTNPGEMPLEVQLQLFKRSFSTKQQEGRGLGTYSMKLFGERYLGGVVNFVSNNGMTTFFIELPLEPEQLITA